MNFRSRTLRRAVLAAALVSTVASGLLVSAASADTSTTPPWREAAAKDPNAVATLSFYDASGAQVTTGSTKTAFGFVAASGPVRAGDDHATLYAYTPVAGTAPGGWSTGTQLAATGAYPIAGAPATLPSGVPALAGGDVTLAQAIAAFPNKSTAAGYEGVYELRLRTSSVAKGVGDGYAVADVVVVGDTWTVYGNQAAKVASTTTVAPPAKAVYGTAFKVAVSVTGAGGTTATGTVTLKSGATVLGTGTVTAGKATITVAGTKLAPGTRPITAVYAGSAALNASTSTTKNLVVAKAVAKVANAVAPKKVKHTKAAKLTVKVTAAGVVPTGVITVFDGTKAIKKVTLTAAKKGKVVITLPKLKKGSHKLHAVYAGSATVNKATGTKVALKST